MDTNSQSDNTLFKFSTFQYTNINFPIIATRIKISVTDIRVHIYVAILGRNGTLFRNTITEINVIKVLI